MCVTFLKLCILIIFGVICESVGDVGDYRVGFAISMSGFTVFSFHTIFSVTISLILSLAFGLPNHHHFDVFYSSCL